MVKRVCTKRAVAHPAADGSEKGGPGVWFLVYVCLSVMLVVWWWWCRCYFLRPYVQLSSLASCLKYVTYMLVLSYRTYHAAISKCDNSPPPKPTHLPRHLTYLLGVLS